MLRILHILALLSISSTWQVAGAEPKPELGEWEEIPNCRLLTNEWNDGDSFHVLAKGRERIFRLYYVDCPEVEKRYPTRVASQAKRFGISSSQVLQAGEQAKTFTLTKLSPAVFTVWTRWEKAKGSSKLPRFYALVQVGGVDLGQLLLENGLARAYGKSTILPDGRKPKSVWKRLNTIESEAKSGGRGAWKMSSVSR